MSDVYGIGAASQAAAAVIVATLQYKVAKEYSNRAEQIHDQTLIRFKDDVLIWTSYARETLISVAQEDAARPKPVARFDEVASRAEVMVRLEFGVARRNIVETADIHAVGLTGAQLNALRIQEAIAINDAVSFARTKEDARVKLEEQVVRQNKLQTIGVIRGNYNTGISGLEAAARQYEQLGAQAGAAMNGTLAAGAKTIGRILGDKSKGDTQRPAPVDERGTPYAPDSTGNAPTNTDPFAIEPSSYWDNPARPFDGSGSGGDTSPSTGTDTTWSSGSGGDY